MSGKVLQIRPSVLTGKVRVSGAKNSALRLLAASLLTEENLTITNFPSGLSDVQVHNEMLEVLGKNIYIENDTIHISENKLSNELIWKGRSIRNTLLIWGALLARTGKSKVPLPGGCSIGDRKYGLHLMILEKLGAKVWEDGKYLYAEAPKGFLCGAEIHLPIRSTGATENAIITSSLAKGKTRIWNPHIRPEILDLISMMRKMGAKIEVRGNESIIVEGVTHLKSAKHKVISDNMEALTFLIAAVITKGDIEIVEFPVKHLGVPLIFLEESGTNIYYGANSIIVRGGMNYPIELSTGPYPGINSDMQPLLAVYGLCSGGSSKIIDLRFPNRFAYSNELKKMGADMKVSDNMLVIEGGKPLIGAEVKADDLRAGAALLLAGLVAEGRTIINNAEQIERGYENFYEKFTNLDAQLRWLSPS